MHLCLENGIMVQMHLALACKAMQITASFRPSLLQLHQCSLPANIATDDDVASEDGARSHFRVDGVRHDTGGHGELDGACVDDAHDVAGSGGLEDAEEGAIAAILRVELDDLLVIVGALEELDPRIERPAVSLDEDFDAVDRRIEGVRAESPTLDGRCEGMCVLRGHVNILGDNVRGDGELDLPNVADGDCVGAAGRLNHGAEGPELAVLTVHAHLHRGVVRSVPELDVSVERAAFGTKDDLHL